MERKDILKKEEIYGMVIKINKSGDYVIFIENYGEKDVDISGYCSVNPYITKEEDKKFEESNN